MLNRFVTVRVDTRLAPGFQLSIELIPPKGGEVVSMSVTRDEAFELEKILSQIRYNRTLTSITGDPNAAGGDA